MTGLWEGLTWEKTNIDQKRRPRKVGLDTRYQWNLLAAVCSVDKIVGRKAGISSALSDPKVNMSKLSSKQNKR